MLTWGTAFVLLMVLVAEAANGWTDAPTGTSAAVASGALTSKNALYLTAAGNFVGLIAALFLGAKVATTIGTGIVRPEAVTVASIGVAMLTTIAWSVIAAWLGLPISKTHSLLAALAGIGYALGGFEALTPASGNWADSGWIDAAKGVFFAIVGGSAAAWFLTTVVIQLKLHESISAEWWKRLQRCTVALVSSGHGFNDGLKYVGIFTLVLYKSGAIPKFQVTTSTILLCAIVMTIGTLIGGWRIHQRLDDMVNAGAGKHGNKKFEPHMGVCAEIVAAFAIWKSGSLGIPMSTNHSVVSAMAGAKSAGGKVHAGSIVKIAWGWIITYMFNFGVAKIGASLVL